jgi:predicted nucleotidyltransferase component of viral defense system
LELAGIYAHEELAESWIFKGGTYLKKCFFETYRFSQDLDFTLRNEVHLDESFLKRVFAELEDRAPIRVGRCPQTAPMRLDDAPTN